MKISVVIVGCLIGVGSQAAQLTIENFEARRARGAPLGRVEYRQPWGERAAFVRPITYDDVLWAARMTSGEGAAPDYEHAAAVIWTVVQRGLCPAWRARQSLTAQFRAFSQPINPKWSCVGESKEKACARYCDPGRPDFVDPATLKPGSACYVRKLRRRAKLQTVIWKELDPVARQAAVDFALGRLPNPVPGVVNFVADCRANHESSSLLFAGNYATGAGRTESCVNVNSFYYENCQLDDGSRQWSSSWPADSVRVIGRRER